MGLDAEGQRGVGALEDTGTKNKRDGKCPVNKELTISMQRVTAALKAPSGLFCKVQRPIQVYATSLYVFIGLDLYLISASKEDAKHRNTEQSYLNAARPSGGRMLRVQTGNRIWYRQEQTRTQEAGA